MAGLRRRIRQGGLIGAGQRGLLLGGGTAIGRRNWRLVLRANGLLLARSRPWYLVGAGVEDPAFQGRNSFSENGELARWKPVCGRFESVTVRGPRSVELLESVGIPARMVGDPALLHEPETLVPPQEKLLGINLGFGDDLWGHDHSRVVDELAGLVKGLAGEDWRVRAIVVNPKDEPAARECLAKAGVTGEVVTTLTTDQFFTAVGPCTVLVAERLHALVLAAAAGIPLVGLEYQPKCRDFLASVGAAERSVRTDLVTADILRSQVEDLAGQRAAESARLRNEVSHLRALLHDEVEKITSAMDR